MATIKLKVNGKSHSFDADADTPLLWVLREELQLVGTKYGCGIGSCGACTVHVDGIAMRSCQMTVEQIGDQPVTTIEGLSHSDQSRHQIGEYRRLSPARPALPSFLRTRGRAPLS